MKTIVVTQYKPLEFLPPVMALLLTLKQMNYNVIYVGVPSVAGEAFLKENSIRYALMPYYDSRLYINKTLVQKITHRLQRLFSFFKKRKWIRQKLLELEIEYGEYILWHSEVLSAALIGDWASRFKKRLITIYELADFNGRWWIGFTLGRLLKEARMVVPEYNRAHIMKEYFRLKELPFVLPNKPVSHPRTRNLPLPTKEIQEVFNEIGGRPVFLYQGVWNEDRADVAKVLETIAKYRPNYCVVTMPECDAVKELSCKYSNVFYVPYLSPPHHLSVTSHATVGIAIYNAAGNRLLQRLGAVYCAPNKIYEYAGFGIPTLGNNLPGLKYTIEQCNAGVCCEMNEESIIEAVDNLIQNIALYSEGAYQYYDQVDVERIVVAILK